MRDHRDQQGTDRKHENKGQNRIGDAAKDAPYIGELLARWVHPASLHFLKVMVSHMPRRDAKEHTRYQPQDAKNQNQHTRWGGRAAAAPVAP